MVQGSASLVRLRTFSVRDVFAVVQSISLFSVLSMVAARTIVALFLTLLLAVPATQWRSNHLANRDLPLLRIFHEFPTAESLSAIQQDMLARSNAVAFFRPKSQWLLFRICGDAGSKVLLGNDNWLFYRPGLEASVLREERLDASTTDAPATASPATASPATGACMRYSISAMHLAARGIDLVVVPAPNKESIYPDQLVSTKATSHRWGELDALLVGLRAAGVNTIDLRDIFSQARAAPNETGQLLYLKRDTHWSPSGLSLAAKAIAGIIRQQLTTTENTTYTSRTVSMEHRGDLVAMLQSPEIERGVAPEAILAQQVVGASGEPIRSSLESPVLLLGDSFLRIFESDVPGSAGLPAHLALELGRR